MMTGGGFLGGPAKKKESMQLAILHSVVNGLWLYNLLGKRLMLITLK
jgi:hypothetical protein